MHKVELHTDCEFCKKHFNKDFLFATDESYEIKKVKCPHCGRINKL